MKGIGTVEKYITHLTLLAGAMIFAFPFLWMLGTSVKVNREMAAESLQPFPRAPRPQEVTPYIDTQEFSDPRRPDGIPEAVWTEVQPLLETALLAKVRSWKPCTPGPIDNAPPSIPDRSLYQGAMVRGLMKLLSARISDEARGRAAAVQRTIGADRKLYPAAIRAGSRAIVADAERLIDEKALQETFDGCYRRLCLGQVRVRTKDMKQMTLDSGATWRVADGDAALVARTDAASECQEARIDFGNQPRVAFDLAPSNAVSELAVDRVYVAYRADASWDTAAFEVIRDGQVYRTTQRADFSDRDWLEQELRWPDGVGDPMQPRTYLVLQPMGTAPPAAPPFAVRMIVTKMGPASAWIGKLGFNYRMAFRQVPYGRYIATSFALAIINIILSIFSCTIVAFAFARLKWPGRDFLFGVLLATMMIPGQVTMIPGFLVTKYLGWYNTLIPLWIYSAFGSAFFIFLLRQFFRNIPTDLEDAARIDGCGFLRVYWHVMMPLVKPTIATIAIFTFMGVWNNFMGPLIYVNDERLFPLALGLFKFNIRSGGDVGLMMAGSFVMTLPIIILFFFVQRYFIQGISLTGVKG